MQQHALNPGDVYNFMVQEMCMEDAAEDFGMQCYKMKDLHPQPQAQEPAPGELYKPTKFDQYTEVGLRAPIEHLALVNPFVDPEIQERAREAQDLTEFDEVAFPFVYDCPDELPEEKAAKDFRKAATFIDREEGPQPKPAAALRANPEQGQQLLPCCFLAGAAAFAAHALDLKPTDAVLDLCAGPGATSLLLASMLFAPQAAAAAQRPLLETMGLEAGQLEAAAPGKEGRLVCNEPDKTRASLLEAMLASFLPERLLGKSRAVTVTKGEVSEKVPLALHRLGPFDKILVDAPCTDARAQAFAAKTSRMEAEKDSSKLKRKAELAEQLLRCAGSLLKPGGTLVYCTTSLQDRENDEAVRRFLRRADGQFEAVQGEKDAPIQGAFCTQHGVQIVPNQYAQHGPLFFARLRHAAN